MMSFADYAQLFKTLCLEGVISLIEDDAAVSMATGRLLRAMGFGVEGFSSAEDFLKSGQREGFGRSTEPEVGASSELCRARVVLQSSSFRARQPQSVANGIIGSPEYIHTQLAVAKSAEVLSASIAFSRQSSGEFVPKPHDTTKTDVDCACATPHRALQVE